MLIDVLCGFLLGLPSGGFALYKYSMWHAKKQAVNAQDEINALIAQMNKEEANNE